MLSNMLSDMLSAHNYSYSYISKVSSLSRNARPDQKTTCLTRDGHEKRFTYGSATMSTHRCGLMTMWVADPRVPIGEASSKHSKPGTAGYYIGGGATHRIGLTFCPFCGESMTGSQRQTPPTKCKHLDQITSLSNSPIRYRKVERDYYIAGRRASVGPRVFYCPTCGRKLLRPGRDTRFYKKSPAELKDLKTRSQGINSIDDAIAKLGPPDIDHGPSFAYLYFGGKRTRFGAVRTLFYTELAKTLMITISESLNGKVTVTFPPKQRNVDYKQVPKQSGNL
jgi:hypothetical protein